MKTLLKLTVCAVAFTVASATTYVAVLKWNPIEEVKSGKHQQDTLEGVNGLSEGEVANLPILRTLGGELVNLSNRKEEVLLCVFIGSRCSGCTLDADLWSDLKGEAARRAAAFYLIDVGDDLAEVQRFSSAFNLDDLPLLFDSDHKVGPQLKVGFLPQYVLFRRNGEVVHRWDGIRRYDKQGGSQQLAKFFQPHE